MKNIALFFVCLFWGSYTHAQCSLACKAEAHISLDETGNMPSNLLDLLLASPHYPPPTEYAWAHSVFDCSNVGDTIEYWIIQTNCEGSGDENSCSGVFIVEDYIAPVLECPSVVYAELDEMGQGEATIDYVVTDNCPVDEMPSTTVLVNCDAFYSPISFSQTYTDAGGNSSTCVTQIIAKDNIAPDAKCLYEITVDLAGGSSVVLTPDEVDGGSTDNCDIVERFLSKSVFTIDDLGMNLITLTVKDQSGNSDMCFVKVYVVNSIYCTSKGINTNYEYIDRVVFESLDNKSGKDGGYGDYTDLGTVLVPGTRPYIYLIPGFVGSSYTEHWSVWIDWNQDHVFEDSERVLLRSSSSMVSQMIYIPYTAKPGLTRMRVAMKYGANSAPCETFTYGEVEDYSVKIMGASPFRASELPEETASEESDFTVFPNPAKDLIHIQGMSPRSAYYILDNQGHTLKQIHPGVNSVDIRFLNPGVYFVALQDPSGATKCKRFIKL